ncbi:MAG: hypothetical protein ACYSR9_15060, partial [Planctomycetota bacterium]
MDESINTANKKQSRPKPPLSRLRIASEILAGMALWIVALLCVYVIGIKLFEFFQVTETEDAALAFLLMLCIVAPPLYVLGSAVGVYLAGNIGKQTGSLLATLGGSVLGGLVMYLLFLVFAGLHLLQG